MLQGRVRRGLLLVAVSLGLHSPPTDAQVLAVDLSSDIPFNYDLLTPDPGAVLRLPAAGAPALVDLGNLPASANVTAFQPLDGDLRLFSLDSFTALPGGVNADRNDVVQYDGTNYTVVFDGSGAGLPAGATIDAIGWRRQAGVTSLWLSSDVTVALPGGLVAEDEDLVAWDGSTWSLVLDGSAAAVPPDLDLDAIDADPVTGELFVSFDGSGRLGGIDFDDDDTLAWNGSAWSLAVSGDALGPSFAAGDLDALAVVTPNVFRDGFESGSVIEWSIAVP